VSSANIIADKCFKQFGKSLIYQMNKRGSSIDPCGTPIVKEGEGEKKCYLFGLVAFYH